MASRLTTFGLNSMARAFTQASGYSASRFARTLAIDDSSVGFAAGDDALNDGGAVANEFDVAFDATPSAPSAGAVTMVATVPAASGILVHRRASWHDDTVTNVTTSSTTLLMGVDGFALTKTGDFSMSYTGVVQLATV